MDNSKKNFLAKKEDRKSKQSIAKINIFLLQYFKIIVLAIVVVFFITIFLYLLKPKYDSIRDDIEMSNENLQTEYSSLEKRFKVVNEYLDAYDKIKKEEVEKINHLLPLIKDVPLENLYALMESIVLKRGMFLVNLNIIKEGVVDAKTKAKVVDTGKDKSPDNFLNSLGKIKINMNVVGVDYPGLKKLLSDFEKSLRIMDVQEVRFSPGQNSVSLEIATYYLKAF